MIALCQASVERFLAELHAVGEQLPRLALRPTKMIVQGEIVLAVGGGDFEEGERIIRRIAEDASLR